MPTWGSRSLSDWGKSFLSQLMKEMCGVLGMKKINTTAYHPQTDGLFERFNRTLTSMLAKIAVDLTGILTSHTYCLHTEPVFRNQQWSLPSLQKVDCDFNKA